MNVLEQLQAEVELIKDSELNGNNNIVITSLGTVAGNQLFSFYISEKQSLNTAAWTQFFDIIIELLKVLQDKVFKKKGGERQKLSIWQKIALGAKIFWAVKKILGLWKK